MKNITVSLLENAVVKLDPKNFKNYYYDKVNNIIRFIFPIKQEDLQINIAPFEFKINNPNNENIGEEEMNWILAECSILITPQINEYLTLTPPSQQQYTPLPIQKHIAPSLLKVGWADYIEQQ